ncbi:MAG: tRNA (adenosine(37)-N6)-dimethylallyltransferase MiaA [Clostridia bacterium]|nr:tRNA (adenosine(37)-N6)-dimethylallyltransferase MiaA [Clostridia bacterium]
MNKVVVIAGPTASGKTAVSIKVAKKINSEIVSSDSVQVYKGLDIGSAKVTNEEIDNVVHHMIDVVDPKVNFSMADFKEMADKEIEKIISENKIPMIVGGTGFYIQSLLRDIELKEEDNDYSYREELEKLASEKGNEYVHEMLKEIDIKSYETIHANNLKRVIRALEYYKMNNEPISLHNETEKEKDYKYDTKFFVLYFKDRDKLYERCDMRVDIMIENGLVDEVRNILDSGVSKDSTAMQAIGYKEVIEYLDNIISYEEMVNKIKINTRHLVKRQYTWFKHQEENAIWIAVDEFNYDTSKIADEIVKNI